MAAPVPNNNLKEVKLHMPLPFSGKREEMTKFWQDCNIHMSVNDDIYNTDKRQIAFVLSLLTQGEAASWKEQFVGQAILNWKKAGVPLDFGTFAVFETNFFEAFKPFDESGDAWAEMCELKFNGKEGNMDEHITRFKTLLTKTGMAESTAVVDSFRETLPKALQQRIILLPDALETLNGWYKWVAEMEPHHEQRNNDDC